MKDFNRFIIIKQGIKTKNIFVWTAYSGFVVKKYWHGNVCLEINDKQRINMPEKVSSE